MYDLIIKNGAVIDGTGSPSYFADIAVKDGKIALIGKGLEGAARIIDATGLTVTPGFIDSHSHNDQTILSFPAQREKIEQGITTAIGGTCASSHFPLPLDFNYKNDIDYGELGCFSEICRTSASYFEATAKVPQGSNVATYVGHNAIRRAVIGSEGRAPTEAELAQMCELVRDAMRAGAIGISFGLAYAPSCYAETEELIALAKAVAEFHGVVSAHIRSEGDRLVQATEEFLRVIRESGARGVFSHHKSAGSKENWGKVNHTLRMIDEANEKGVDVYLDVYPYDASHTSLSATIVPKKYHDGGVPALMEALQSEGKRREIRAFCESKWSDFDWIQITICKGYPEYEGLRIPEIAKRYGKDEVDTMLDIILASNGRCSACYFTMCEEDIETVIAHPRAMICTDSQVAGNNKVYHPRLRGSFPRALAKYVRERAAVTLPDMIRKMTAMPAAVYSLTGKGLLREGMDADICIFDAARIKDNATFADCSKRADGLSYVILSGEVVVTNAVHDGRRRGRVLRRDAEGRVK